MDQDVAINKALRDMKQAGLITRDEMQEIRSGEMRVLLNAVYTVGWENRNKDLADKRSIPVQQLTKEGKFMEEFHNIQIAARKKKYARGTIYKSLRTGETTSRGHIWKYKEDNEKKGNDRDTDTGRKG